MALRRHVKFLTALIIKRNNTDRAVTIIIIYTHPSETSYTNTLSDIERRLGITHGKILNSATTNLQEVRIMKPRRPRGIERERERGGGRSIGNGVTEFRDSFQRVIEPGISDSLPDSMECIDLSSPVFPPVGRK